MSLHLLTILTGQGDVSELLVSSQYCKGRASVLAEVVPLQTQLFISARHFFGLQINFDYLNIEYSIPHNLYPIPHTNNPCQSFTKILTYNEKFLAVYLS